MYRLLTLIALALGCLCRYGRGLPPEKAVSLDLNWLSAPSLARRMGPSREHRRLPAHE